MDILREAAEQVKQRLYPDQGAKPEKKGEELAGFVKDTQAAAGAPAGPPAGPEEHEQQVGSKEGLSDKVEALAEDARSKVGPVSHGIRVPSIESMTSRDVSAPVEEAKATPQAPSQGVTTAPETPEQGMPAPAAPGDTLPASMAAGGQAPAVPEGSAAPAMADKGMMPEEGGAMVEEGVSGPAAGQETGAMGPTSPRQSFEERTYQMSRGAETPDGSLEKLHLHHQQGEEFEGAALSGKTEPFAKPPHGAGASGADQDRPVKLTMGHDYKHETADQQQMAETETAAPATGTTPETGPADASHMSLEAGGQTTETTGTTIGEPVTGVPIKETGFETTDAAEASRMSLEAGAETDITETKAGTSSEMAMPARREMMPADQPAEVPEVPEMLQDVVGSVSAEEAESGPHAGTATGLGAPHKKDFESETNADAQGAESPDGKMEALHLHAEHGLEGPGSKADQQLGAVLQEGAPHPPPGAGASSSVQDPPDKMMPHRKEEAGVAGRAGATDLTNLTGATQQQQEGQQQGQQMKGAAIETTGTEAAGTQGQETSGMEASSVEAGEGSGSAAGMVPHQKDLEAETNMEAKGAETPDGPLEALHLHAEHGLEGPGSKADQQLGAVLQEGAPQPPPGAGATTSAQDPPDKMMWHHKEEAGMGGAGNAAAKTATGNEGQATAATQEMQAQGAPSGMATFQEEPDFQREPSVTGTPTEDTSATAAPETGAETGSETAGVGELGDGHVLKEEGVKKLAEAMAEVTGAGSPAEVLLRGEQKSEEVQKSERMREEGHKDPYVPEAGEEVEQAAVDSTSAGGGGMPAPQEVHDMAPEGTQAASTTAAHEATAGVGAYSRAAEGEMQGQQAGAGNEPKSSTDAPVSTSSDTAGMGMGGGYFAPGKGGGATTEAAHEGYIADPSASLPAHKTRVPVEVKHPGDPGVEPSGTDEPPHTTTGGTVFDLGTIKEAQVDHTTGTKDFPENLAAP